MLDELRRQAIRAELKSLTITSLKDVYSEFTGVSQDVCDIATDMIRIKEGAARHALTAISALAPEFSWDNFQSYMCNGGPTPAQRFIERIKDGPASSADRCAMRAYSAWLAYFYNDV